MWVNLSYETSVEFFVHNSKRYVCHKNRTVHHQKYPHGSAVMPLGRFIISSNWSISQSWEELSQNIQVSARTLQRNNTFEQSKTPNLHPN